MNKISAIVLVGGKLNKDLLRKCLATLSWCDEIVKVETSGLSGSFADWRNLGAKKAKGDWLFYVDADEEVTENLKNTILTVTQTNEFSAFAIPRRNFIWGKEMKYCGLWPDYVLRVIKKDKLMGWVGDLHEQPKVDGKIDHLTTSPLIHHKNSNVADMLDKTNKWSEIEAQLMYASHHPKMNIARFASAGLREFWQRMVIQTAFLDGTPGIIYAFYQVYSRLISYSKLWEKQLKN